MNLSNRKYPVRQAELTSCAKISLLFRNSRRLLSTASLAAVFCLTGSFSEADIYRFVTIDGVETFTDAPSDKSAVAVIKDRRPPTTRQRTTQKKQKIHDISLDEIAHKAVMADLHQHEPSQNSIEPHLLQVEGTITSRVGMRIDPIDGKWRQHNGIDIAVPAGTPVNAVAPGVVVYSGNRSGYGNTVVVEHDNGVITLYAHNSRIMVIEGQEVTSESILALSGSTGRSTGPHLHFEAWQSGSNISEAFLPDSGMSLPNKALVASSHRPARFRSEALSDGSILFTNLPATTR